MATALYEKVGTYAVGLVDLVVRSLNLIQRRTVVVVVLKFWFGNENEHLKWRR
jgi:hypothetical protein